MPRLKVNRFRARKPPADVLAFYLRVYNTRDLYFDPESLPPLSPQELFGSAQPVVFDLGCGRGEFLIGQAAEHPDINFVGFDLHWKSLWDAINKSRRAGLQNVRFVRTDYRRAFAKVPDGCVQAAYLLFPPPIIEPNRQKEDPLPPETVHDLARTLPDGAPFHLVTDHPGFFAAKTALIEETGRFERVHTSQAFEGGLTWYQQLWESLDIQSLRVEYRRRTARG
jgi:tRNA G46 methylase TrmB